MKRFALAAAFLVSTGAEAQTLRRVPLTGFVDRTGEVVEPATWEAGSTFFRGDWVAVRREGKAGFLNLRTRATTGLSDFVENEAGGRALFVHGPEPVRIGGQWGYADEAGKIVIEPRFARARAFDEDGLAIVWILDKKGFGSSAGMIDRIGRVVVEPRYGIVRSFRGAELTVVSRAGRFGAIDRTGREVIPMRYGAIGSFAANGLAPATLKGDYGKDGSLWGYIDRNGRFVIPERFSFAGDFAGDSSDGEGDAPAGLARVGLGPSESVYIDAKGAIVTRLPPGVVAWGFSPNGLVRFQDQTTALYGFADAKTGAIVIPARFSAVSGFDDHGFAAVREGERAGFIHADGNWVFPPRFTTANSFDALGQAQVTEDGRSELIDRDGNVLATLTHGKGIFHKDSEFAAFRVFPGQEEAPTQRFGTWALDATLYAVREVRSSLPTSTGNVRLSGASDDALVRWRIETEGWVVTLVYEEGPSDEPDVTRQVRLADFPPDAETLVALFGRQLEGQSAISIATAPVDTAAQAAQAERVRRISANRASYLAQLCTSTPDLARALTAMRTRVSDQFGKLSGMPCMPPRCVY